MCRSKRRSGVARNTWRWVKRDLPEHADSENEVICIGPALNATSPLEMFLCHLGDATINLILFETNRMRLETNKTKYRPVEELEMRKFLGICLYMSVVDLPFRRMYWSRATRQPIVANALSINRFEEILSLLHVNDNQLQSVNGTEGYDRLYKVRPLLTNINRNFSNCAQLEKFMAIDEQIIPFKGRHSLKVYMRNKPKKWGYKVWALAGQYGYLYKFQFYGDNLAGGVEIQPGIGASGKVVIDFAEGVPEGTYLFFDNYFASPELLVELTNTHLYATCTMRKNRSGKCPLKCEKDLKKMGRESYDFRSENGILLCEWFDNRTVLVGSNVHGVEPANTVSRYNRKEKRYVEVKCPRLITVYNKNMGGVDRCDMLLALYRNAMKTRKWYKRIIFHLIDLCVVNAWTLSGGVRKMSLYKFKLAVATGLIEATVAPHHEQVPGPAPAETQHNRDVSHDSRYDGVGHLVKQLDANVQRCKMEGCRRRTKFVCVKCRTTLCVDIRSDCFYRFHTK